MILDTLEAAFTRAVRDNGWEPPDGQSRVVLEAPRDRTHGDLASNIAMTLARSVRKPPREVAEKVVSSLPLEEGLVGKIEIAGPGFINIRLTPAALHRVLLEVLDRGTDYGRTEMGGGLPVQVEFVSANPTGPLNVVSARAAAVGDALVRLLEATGHRAASEFYVNDAGRQVDLLGASFRARYAELHGESVEFPEDGYHGEYITELAAEIPQEQFGSAGEGTGVDSLREWALDRMLRWQQEDLDAYGVRFDRWYRESELHRSGALEATLADLETAGHVYEADGARWFRSTTFDDEKDRVLVRSGGDPTYFLADIAYHRDKYERGFHKVIDLWGPDHHGHIKRMQGALRALGIPEDFLEIEIVQWVRLLSGGEPVKMSKRAGEFITLRDLIDEVGVDNARYSFLVRSTSSHLDFDLEVAKAQNDENPAYYVQYAHARISSVVRYAEQNGIEVPEDPAAVLGRLNEDEELDLLKDVLLFPQMLQGAARAREPHRIPTYLAGIAEGFHRFYHHHRVVTEDREQSEARLLFCLAVRQVLRNGLALMGVGAPDRM